MNRLLLAGFIVMSVIYMTSCSDGNVSSTDSTVDTSSFSEFAQDKESPVSNKVADEWNSTSDVSHSEELAPLDAELHSSVEDGTEDNISPASNETIGESNNYAAPTDNEVSNVFIANPSVDEIRSQKEQYTPGNYNHFTDATNRTLAMAKDIEAYLRENLLLTDYGGMDKHIIDGSAEFGITIWVVNQEKLDTLLQDYPYEICEMVQIPTTCSLEDLHTIEQKIDNLLKGNSNEYGFTLLEEFNQLRVYIRSGDSQMVASIEQLVSESGFDNHIMIDVNPQIHPTS